VDGGRTLWSGVRGALVSLPEIFFLNIRKGTYAFDPAALAPEPSQRTSPLPAGS
jgi:hypothetical protein